MHACLSYVRRLRLDGWVYFLPYRARARWSQTSFCARSSEAFEFARYTSRSLGPECAAGGGAGAAGAWAERAAVSAWIFAMRSSVEASSRGLWVGAPSSGLIGFSSTFSPR